MIYTVIAAVILISDFITKFVVSHNVNVGDTFASIQDIVNLTYVQNRGAAFSMMAGKLSFLSLISIGFCVIVILYWINKKPTHPLLCTAISMMFAGALGNAIDRIFYGYVVDFISVQFIDFPVFNIADVGITVGAVLIVIYVIFFDKNEVKNKKLIKLY